MNSLNNPKIGILCWEEGQVPKAISQIAKLKGSCTNPFSYDYPILIKRVKGINADTIVINPDPKVIDLMIMEMHKMVEQGVLAIATSCGFNAVHQQKLADSIEVPVFSSSLMQIPFVWKTLSSNQSIGVITAREKSLTKAHFNNVGVTNEMPFHVYGVEDYSEWSKLLNPADDITIDPSIMEKEIASLSLKITQNHPNIGAFVIECTDMPPFSDAIRKATRLPVFDFITMANYIVSSF